MGEAFCIVCVRCRKNGGGEHGQPTGMEGCLSTKEVNVESKFGKRRQKVGLRAFVIAGDALGGTGTAYILLLFYFLSIIQAKCMYGRLDKLSLFLHKVRKGE